MKAIVAVDLNWGIGYQGELLQRLPEDLKFFKQMTLGKVVVMGRKTLDSLPGRQPLKDRINIVLSNTESFRSEKVTFCRSMSDLFRQLEQYHTDDVFVIGGESIYSQLLPLCTEVYVTKILNKYVADKHFTNLDEDVKWRVDSISDIHHYDSIQYCFVKYLNNTSQ